jgi:hypothetical protein
MYMSVSTNKTDLIIISKSIINFKSMRHLITIIFILSFILGLNSLSAQAPPRISIQGQLKDATGALVADGSYTVEFRLYDNLVGSTANYAEIATVEIVGGVYSHYLGSVTPLVATFFDQTQYLGVKIGASELKPRTELTYAPYTFSSNTTLSADKVKCSGAVGDIKYSMYNPTQFAAVNGDCWVPMDGRNITSKKLASIIGANNVPDASGLFFRAHEYSGNEDPDRTPGDPVAVLQPDAIGGHTHTASTTSAGDHSHSVSGTVVINGANTPDGIQANGRWGVVGSSSTTTSTAPDHTHTLTINNSGSTETRPKNMNFYVYIRVD